MEVRDPTIGITKEDRNKLNLVAKKRGMSARSMTRSWIYRIYKKEFGDSSMEGLIENK